MLIFDGQVAVVPMDSADSKRGALIVRQSALIAGLRNLFERIWEPAQELLPSALGSPDALGSQSQIGEGGVITDQDRRLLAMLASGVTDETAAREIGVSVRHLRRRISRLMSMLGARSRFEAGVEAARRGWL
jgi:DNA-binding NarL/FixJ family response regulator